LLLAFLHSSAYSNSLSKPLERLPLPFGGRPPSQTVHLILSSPRDTVAVRTLALKSGISPLGLTMTRQPGSKPPTLSCAFRAGHNYQATSKAIGSFLSGLTSPHLSPDNSISPSLSPRRAQIRYYGLSCGSELYDKEFATLGRLVTAAFTGAQSLVRFADQASLTFAATGQAVSAPSIHRLAT